MGGERERDDFEHGLIGKSALSVGDVSPVPASVNVNPLHFSSETKYIENIYLHIGPRANHLLRNQRTQCAHS